MCKAKCLVFRKKYLYLIITQKLTFMKSGGFHQVKSTQNLIKSDVSTKTLQFGGCREGAMTPDFMKSGVIAPLLHSSNWIVLVETFAFIRFWVNFTWNLPDFMRISWKPPDFIVKSKDHLQGIVTLCFVSYWYITAVNLFSELVGWLQRY